MTELLTMTCHQKRLGYRIAAQVRGLDLERLAPQLAPGQPLEVALVDEGVRDVARVEVRHPLVQRRGTSLLLGLIELVDGSEARLTYVVPAYRLVLEHALRAAGVSS